MKFTDADIKMLQLQALIEDAIRSCQLTIGDMARLEAEIKNNRLTVEGKLGELLGYKTLLEANS